jgi:hypothetical protein
MTPRKLNEEIRAGATFWVRDPNRSGREHTVKDAKSVKRAEQEYVKVLTNIGWLTASEVRRAGTEDWIPLEHEGVMTWAVN